MSEALKPLEIKPLPDCIHQTIAGKGVVCDNPSSLIRFKGPCTHTCGENEIKKEIK